MQWDRTAGGNWDDNLSAVLPTKDGGYLLGGFSSSEVSGERTAYNRGDPFTDDFWLVKLDSDGHVEWDKTLGGSEDYEWLLSAMQTNDGGYIAGGYSPSPASGDKTENSKGYSDYWLVKLSATGTKQYDKTLGGNLDDYFQTVIQTADNGLLIGGSSFSGISGDKTEAAWGSSYDNWLVKLNKRGMIEWDKTVGGTAGDQLAVIRGYKGILS